MKFTLLSQLLEVLLKNMNDARILSSAQWMARPIVSESLTFLKYYFVLWWL